MLWSQVLQRLGQKQHEGNMEACIMEVLGMIIFQGNMLGRPKDMKTAKHAETG